jgi:Tol biopolymer transport system component
VLDETAVQCEGDPGITIAPGSRHLMYASVVYSMAGEQLVELCQEGFARSAAWSQDGRYAYAACSGEGSDTLRRYDTQTGQATSLTDPTAQTFRAIALIPSPDQNHILIVWGNNHLSMVGYGVWLLDLLQP